MLNYVDEYICICAQGAKQQVKIKKRAAAASFFALSRLSRARMYERSTYRRRCVCSPHNMLAWEEAAFGFCYLRHLASSSSSEYQKGEARCLLLLRWRPCMQCCHRARLTLAACMHSLFSLIKLSEKKAPSVWENGICRNGVRCDFRPIKTNLMPRR